MTLFSRHLNILKPIGLTVAISLAAYSCVWEAGDEGILDEELMFAVSTGKPADDPTRSRRHLGRTGNNSPALGWIEHTAVHPHLHHRPEADRGGGHKVNACQ